jgi:hypothetical protein
LSNAGSLISFRLGSGDAPIIAREMQPIFEAIHLLNLPNHHFYVRLMIDGVPSKGFSARTIVPV